MGKTDESSRRSVSPHPASILSIDIGGSKVKILASGQTEPRKMPSGKSLTPMRMVEGVRELASDWGYDAVSLGYPGNVGENGPVQIRETSVMGGLPSILQRLSICRYGS